MNRNIEIVFKEDVYCDWKVFKKVIEAMTKNKVKSIGDYKVSREDLS